MIREAFPSDKELVQEVSGELWFRNCELLTDVNDEVRWIERDAKLYMIN